MAEHVASSHPKWFTPLRLLLIFCFTNLFVYLDRGGSRGPGNSFLSDGSCPRNSGMHLRDASV